ncbi:Uncharacterised protein [Mycobacteroides abscessus subsp. abscessus]|nr:Uncharacterised protein [Mycobacteroides abscessus subsp. abscessus]
MITSRIAEPTVRAIFWVRGTFAKSFLTTPGTFASALGTTQIGVR